MSERGIEHPVATAGDFAVVKTHPHLIAYVDSLQRKNAEVLDEVKWQGPPACVTTWDEKPRPVLPEDAAERKKYPLYRGLLRYFPDALAAVARCSWEGNEQHHPGTELHWDKNKSTDEPDALIRHMLDAEHSIPERTKVAWRALAWLQRGIEGEQNDG